MDEGHSQLDQELIEAIAGAASAAKRITVTTGAGVSAESGIPTFREAQTGLWAKYDPVMLASVEGFNADPANVWRWYDERRQTMHRTDPNPGHFALAEWERVWRERGRSFHLITQNIDDLHGRSGSTDIIELHGNIWYVRRVGASMESAVRLDECPLPDIPPRDGDGHLLRPHVVWFGEALDQDTLMRAFDSAGRCDLIFVAGTSSVVYPAAAIPYEAKRAGATVVEINPNKTELTRFADYAVQAPSGVALPAIWNRVKELLAAN